MNILSICKKAWGTLVALLFVFGCTNDVDKGLPSQEGLHEVVFHAGWDPETKTVLQEDLSIWWSPGDEISMFTGEGYNGGYRLTSNNIEPSANVDFVGQIDFGSPYYAIYPYNSLNSFDGTDFVIPFWDQIAVEDSFQEGAMKSIAVSSDNHLYFKNVCGGIRFSVENEGITKIQLQTDGFISGFLKFRLNEAGEPECAGEAPYGASGSILIHAPNDVGFQPNKYYYVALPSAQVLNNLQMTFHKKDSSAIWSYSSPVEIHRSAFKMLERVDKGLKFHKDAYENAAVLYSFLPDDIGKENITGIVFNVNDATVTGNQISASVPVYYAVDGTTVNIYTSADLYDISSVAGCFFNGYSALQTLDLSNTIVPNASSFAEMFMNCISLESIIFGDWDTYKVQNMEYMFYRCEKLCSLDLSFMDTEKVNSMRACFSECKCLSSIDLSSFNTSNVTDMSSLFAGCQALSSLDIHSFNTGNVKDMYSMFHLCRRLEFLDLSGFDTSNVTDMSQMFLDCQNLKQLNIASFNT